MRIFLAGTAMCIQPLAEDVRGPRSGSCRGDRAMPRSRHSARVPCTGPRTTMAPRRIACDGTMMKSLMTLTADQEVAHGS